MGVRGAPLSEIDRFFGALTPHARVIQAADSYPELSPLSTHSKKASPGFLAKAFRLLGNDMRTAPHQRAAATGGLRRPYAAAERPAVLIRHTGRGNTVTITCAAGPSPIVKNAPSNTVTALNCVLLLR